MSSLRLVTPREGRVSRNTRNAVHGTMNRIVTPREGRVSRNNGTG